MKRMVHLSAGLWTVLLMFGPGCTGPAASGSTAPTIVSAIGDAVASGVANAISGLVQAGLLTLVL
jgi:hypothetical protein